MFSVKVVRRRHCVICRVTLGGGRTLPGSTTLTDTSSQPGPALPTAAVTCSGPVRQRDSAFFSGTDDTDVEDWLATYECVSQVGYRRKAHQRYLT